MRRGYRLYLEDILTAIVKIQRFIDTTSFEEFIVDDKTYDAVIRNFEIIGEASKNIPQEVQDNYPAVDWKKVYLFRNVLAHEYFGIDNQLLWDIIQNRLPELSMEIQSILEKGNTTT
ncbi:HepT-like ribonuclease domain-containing protein [Candidatus Magnetomonas plexicatena]|uniref:HepT-like ribonuclease domain-containing protein n=1 Tax=Candidatus Magnetomonas plexicatena TaxID=2552947 RepID=UPI001C7930CD|nr:DUF86 domain-containing protein [Nitrospirales bacterium LBB_01]